MDTIKILVKVSADDNNDPRWVHLCYIDKQLYEAFIENHGGIDKDFICKHCKEDFDFDLKLCTDKDLSTLRDLVKDHYSKKYPEIYLESPTDRQGWLRIWVTNKIKEELYGKASI